MKSTDAIRRAVYHHTGLQRRSGLRNACVQIIRFFSVVGEFERRDCREALAGLSDDMIDRALQRLECSGLIVCTGQDDSYNGGAVYRVAPDSSWGVVRPGVKQERAARARNTVH